MATFFFEQQKLRVTTVRNVQLIRFDDGFQHSTFIVSAAIVRSEINLRGDAAESFELRMQTPFDHSAASCRL